MKRKSIKILGFLMMVALIIALVHSVPLRPTMSERQFFEDILAPLQLPEDLSEVSYAEQIGAIEAIQLFTLDKIQRGLGIPFNESREPAESFHSGEGECYDRSRFMEKVFRYKGLKTRHLSVYPNESGLRPLRLLLSSGVPSHATTEVLTAKGWLIVDTNYEWISMDKDSLPIGIADIDGTVEYLHPVPERSAPFYRKGNVIVYGLYSRHGRFFPPYNPLPDVNYRELLINL